MAKMTPSDRERFVADVRVGVLALPRGSNAPLTSPVWYDYADGRLWFVTYRGTRKSEIIRVGTTLALCVQSEDPPYAYVTVEGRVRDVQAADEAALDHMAKRYLGEKGAEIYAATASSGLTLIVTVEPTRWLSADFSG